MGHFEHAVGRIRFEKTGATAFDFGIRAVCGHCGTPLLIQKATLHLDMEDFPTAEITVAAPELGDLVFHLDGVEVIAGEPPRVVQAALDGGPNDAAPGVPARGCTRTAELRDGASGGLTRAVVQTGHTDDCECPKCQEEGR